MNEDLLPEDDEGLDKVTFNRIHTASQQEESCHSSSQGEYLIHSEESKKQ